MYDVTNRTTKKENIEKIISISAGDNFFIFTSVDIIPNVITLKANGENLYGKLGIGKEDDFVTGDNNFEEIPIDSENIKSISCGLNHSIAIDEDGKVFTWGNNNNGQLVTGDKISRNIPTRAHSQKK